MTRYPPPRFVDPEPYGFIYLGVQAEPAQRFPVHTRTPHRRREAAQLVAAAAALARRPDVARVNVYRAVLIPPLPGVPRYNLAVLIRTVGAEQLDTVRACAEVSALGGEQILAGVNAARIGDTEARTDGTFLFNHFTAGAGVDAEAVWRSLTGWYTSRTAVDNSTALRPAGASPFALVNYVRLPAGPLRFLIGQLTRPSFHRFVRGTLDANGMRALPAFHRLVHTCTAPTDDDLCSGGRQRDRG
ncbi:hypothetical protein [Micromonospora endophytica]|uniref:Uncharacterized protein n=1 Tax=Micromonospora endophytica TaxID=515350 RepID=A0A2W2DEB7_9ACTN|nr:hypothetical protein [Micromonospora endophytica]PZF95476.1 hypothetical protein C1I93_15165 [Micromonospora endophytica]RIW51404.1 hypothetical protein D3H59_00615 [Micromonospora endophytica]BCJ62113.1 hypothetical protein Jiend_55350 [Micromonospora endophytica]